MILVGRGTNQLVGEPGRCVRSATRSTACLAVYRTADLEGSTPEHACSRCTEIDRTRDRFNRYFYTARSTPAYWGRKP